MLIEITDYRLADVGYTVRFNGFGRVNYPFHDDGKVSGRMADAVREAVKGKEPEPKLDPVELNFETYDTARIKSINQQLNELGALTITTIDEIPNAKAFIQYKRAMIFMENDGA